MDDASVAKAVSDLGIDLSDEEDQRREPIFKVGKALEADLVILVYAGLVAAFSNLLLQPKWDAPCRLGSSRRPLPPSDVKCEPAGDAGRRRVGLQSGKQSAAEPHRGATSAMIPVRAGPDARNRRPAGRSGWCSRCAHAGPVS